MTAIDDRTVAVWLFDEKYDSVLPADSAETLAGLEVGSGLSRPAVAPALQDVISGAADLPGGGFGRAFTAAPATGLEVADAGDDLQLTRSLSIVAIVALDTAGQDAAGTPGTIVWRGRDAEETPFGLRVTVEDAGADFVRLQLLWEDEAGALAVDQGVLVTWPDGEEFLLAAIREVEGSGFAVRYVVNGQAADGGVGHGLEVGAASGSDVFVGAEPSGASSYVNHLVGTISYLELLGEAIAVEEVQRVWRKFADDSVRGVANVRGLLPPGAYSRDPTSFVQREVALEGAALGDARNRARRDDEFPQSAYGPALDRWERLTGRLRREDDSIDQRQARIVEYLQLHPGLETDDLLAELLESLGYDDPADITQLLYTVDRSEDFAAASSPGSAAAKIDQGNAVLTVAGGALQFDAAAQDLRFDPSVSGAPFHIFGFTDSLDVFFGGAWTRNALPTADDVLVGFMIGSHGDWLWVGLVYDGADHHVSTIRFSGGALEAGFTSLGTIADATVHFRCRHRGDGAYDVQWGASDAAAQAQAPTEVAGPADPLWAGPAAVAIAASTSIDFSFDDWYSHEANGVHPLTYRLYRDPADPGEYDVGVAQDLLQAIGHAHYEGYVTDIVQLLCDNTGGCDREGMGL